MWRRWRLFDWQGSADFAQRSELSLEEMEGAAPAFEARRRLGETLGVDGGAHGDSARHTIVEMLQACGHSASDLGHMPADALVGLLGDAVEDRLIVMLGTRETPTLDNSHEDLEEVVLDAVQSVVAPTKEKTWVEVEIVFEDGTPYTGPYQLKLPSGETRTSPSLDAEGGVRIDDIDPGDCEVTFPELDAADWKPA